MIVLVEDDRDTRDSIGDFLKSINVKYVATDNVEDGIKLLDTLCPAILLTDLKLKDYMADALIEHCTRHHPDCKSILITASSPMIAERYVDKLHVDHILYKPFNIEDLEQVLKPMI